MASLPSPLAPQSFPNIIGIKGVTLRTAAAGIRYQGRDDVALIQIEGDAVCAAVFTQSACRSAAVDHSRKVLKARNARAIIVNSGNANAFSGQKGIDSNLALAKVGAQVCGCDPAQVFTASTGVIGESLPLERLNIAAKELERAEPSSFKDVAEAIRTTDTYAKGAQIEFEVNGESVRIAGVAKGSGMIAPDMATMLAFIFTDAHIEAELLQIALNRANTNSFNAITVDSDTSTSDSCYLVATAKANNKKITDISSTEFVQFQQSLEAVMLDLAKQIVRDGEGAQKFISISVTGATSDESAKRIAMSIGNSPLVKTAIAGEDANWGRVIMAVGKAGEQANRDSLSVKMGGLVIAENGGAVANYDEKKVAQHLKGQEIDIEVDLNIGNGSATIYTCDLTHGYIDINADYRS